MTNKPEPPPKGQMEYDKWSDKAFVNRYEKSLAGTPEPRSSDECIVCGATLLPTGTPPHCEDCVLTDEHYDKWEVGTPEPSRCHCGYFLAAGMTYCPSCKAGTPETPSAPSCSDCEADPCAPDCRCPCHKRKGETPSAPERRMCPHGLEIEDCPECFPQFGKSLQEYADGRVKPLVQIEKELEGETPSALSAAEPSELKAKSDNAYCDYIAQMRRDECLGWEAKVKTGKFGEKELEAHTKAGELLGKHRAFAEAEAYAATLREEIEDLRGMVRDERALRKGQLEEVEGKLATAQQTIEDLQDCASLEGNAKATERALEAEKKLATAERERDSLNETVEMLLRYRKAAEAELAQEREFREGYANKLASTQVELARVKERVNKYETGFVNGVYEGTYEDWVNRAHCAEAKIEALRKEKHGS